MNAIAEMKTTEEESAADPVKQRVESAIQKMRERRTPSPHGSKRQESKQ